MFSGYIRQNFEIFVELCNSGAMTHVAPGIELPRFLMCHCTKGLEKAVFYMRRQAHLKSSFLNTIPLLDFRTAMVNKHEWITGVRYSCFSLMRGSRENIEDNSVVYEVGVSKKDRARRALDTYIFTSQWQIMMQALYSSTSARRLNPFGVVGWYDDEKRSKCSIRW